MASGTAEPQGAVGGRVSPDWESGTQLSFSLSDKPATSLSVSGDNYRLPSLTPSVLVGMNEINDVRALPALGREALW